MYYSERPITDWDEVDRLIRERERHGGKAMVIVAEELKTAVKRRVMGQDHVVDDLADFLMEQAAKNHRRRPVANLLFLGPTGTGKTELVRALAEHLYGDERNVLEFLGPDLFGPEAKSRLIGVPTGYVGSDRGGQLTSPIMNNGRQLVCFDEIEKACPEVCDLFLQMMGDGRLTEQGSGQAADFTQAIIVLTSNAEHEAMERIREQVEDPDELANAIKSHLADRGVFRPEIMGRIDRVYLFRPLPPDAIARIAGLKIEQLAREYSLDLEHVEPRLILEAMERGTKLARFGVRELERTINRLFGRGMVEARNAGAECVRLEMDEAGRLVVTPLAASADSSAPIDPPPTGMTSTRRASAATQG